MDDAPIENSSTPGTHEGPCGLLSGLTDPQRAGVTHTEGPLLILAAAGSGKTRVITRRIAYLVACGIPGWQILALTFTNKAAGEMRERVARLLAPEHGFDERASRGLTVTTFHALGARLLRRHADAVPGLKPDFSIYDAGDQSDLCKKVLGALEINTSNFPPRSVLSAISAAKNALQGPEEYAAAHPDFFGRTVAKAFAAYERGLRAANAVDFDDLLVLTARLLRSSATVRDACRARWRYLMIDEYQDTNHAQFVVASLLAGEKQDQGLGPNIAVVGDPDQAIYGWRGADIGNILEFEEHYPGARVITLGENFRSTAPILAVADRLVRHNLRRKHKDLFTSRAGGEPVEVLGCRDERDEASRVADWLAERRDEGIAWKEMAIFYRTNALSRVVEDSLRQRAIPYVVARGTAFYQREEVKHALAYLRVVANQADGVSLRRIVNVPARGLGASSLSRIEDHAQLHDQPLAESLRAARQIEGVSPKAAGAALKFCELLDEWTGHGTFMGVERAAEESGGSLSDLVARVLRESGLEEMYRAQARASGAEADADRLDNLDELVSSARQFELEYDPTSDPAAEREVTPHATPLDAEVPPLLAMLRGFLESVALVADADAIDPAQGAVTLMTLHAAKGLEFPAAAIVGLEEGMLPHSRSFESEAFMEEERRLLFVGITRAMRRLLITNASMRTSRGVLERTIPSRFLAELGEQGVRRADLDDASWDGTHLDGPRIDRSESQLAGGGRGTDLPVGTRVRHPQFGLGRVLGVSGGANARAQIRFDDAGVKTLVLQYARLERVR